MTLTEDDGVTTLRTLVRHTSKEHRDGHVQSGMEGGMQVTFDRLDDLLAIADTTVGAVSAGRRHQFGDRVAERCPPIAGRSPTPCDGWTARDVVRHLVDWVPSLIGRGRHRRSRRVDDDRSRRGVDDASPTVCRPRSTIPRSPRREFDVGPPGVMTVEQAIGMLVVGDVLVHTWDLAEPAVSTRRVDDTVGRDARRDGTDRGDAAIERALRPTGDARRRRRRPDEADRLHRPHALTGPVSARPVDRLEITGYS